MEQPKSTESTGKRSVHRSPKYPGLTFTDALERIKIIYKEDRRSPATAQVVLRHLGLTAGSGPANRILSALKQYGLLDDLAGQLRVSDTAFKMLTLSEGSPEKAKLMSEAALKPPIIKEVLEAFPEGLPSDANLSDFLISEKSFNPDSVSFFIKVVRDNLSVAQAIASVYRAPGEQHEEAGMDQGGETSLAGGVSAETMPEISAPYTYPLSKECMGYVRFRGRPTQEDVDRLIKFLELSKSAFPDSPTGGDDA
jgi:hypothetical protein